MSSCLLLIVLLWLAPLLEALPKCVLASIILVALKGMFCHFRDMVEAWKLSKLDAAIWVVVFLSTVLFDVDLGLLIGIGFSLLIVLVRAHRPSVRMLGQLGDTDIYEDVLKYKAALEAPGVKIFQFGGPLYFANREYFKEEMYRLVVNPKKLFAMKKKQAKDWKSAIIKIGDKAPKDEQGTGNLPNELTNGSRRDVTGDGKIHHVVLDCTCWSFIDGSALSTLSQLVQEYKEVDINILFAGCRDNVMDVIERSQLFPTVKSNIFPTLHDAVLHCGIDNNQQDTTQEPSSNNVPSITASYVNEGYTEQI
jgi:MFS superfamily sulfate permease-like transporter